MKIADYKGYEIHFPTSGGKAGKGHQKTSTIQVMEPNRFSGGHMLKIAFRFTMADANSRQSAIKRAKEFCDLNSLAV